MTDPGHEEPKAQSGEQDAPFELTGEEAISPEAAAKALAEHQMEAIEEIHEASAFDLAEEPPLLLDLAEAKKIILTLLFVAHEPLRPRDISLLFRGVANVNVKVVRKILAELVEEYAGHTLQIVEVAEGFRMCTRTEFGPWVRRFLKAERKARLSQAGLETLAIIAYKQPITRPEIEEIRRVDCSGVLNTLLERNLVRILGRRDVVGRPIVYGTTPQFLEHFGFKSLADMPKPEEFEAVAGLAAGSPQGDLLPIDEAAGGSGGEAAGGPLPLAAGDNGHANGDANGDGALAAEEGIPEAEEERP